MRFFNNSALAFVLVLIAGEALAMRICPPDPCKSMLKGSALVFLGKAVATFQTTEDMRAQYDKTKESSSNPYDKLPDTYTDFEVKTVYKGAPGTTKARVYYNSGNIPGAAGRGVISLPYADASEQLIFGFDHHGFLYPADSGCGRCTEDSLPMKELKASYDALDALIAQYPNAAEFYQKKAALMEENSDFVGAQAVREKMHANVKGVNANPENVIAYGKGLYRAGKYEEALKALEPVKGDSRATPFFQLSLLHLAKIGDLGGQKLQLAGQELSNFDIHDVDLSGADFSGAKISGMKFNNVILKNTNFSNAQMAVEFFGSDLSGAKLDGIKLRGKIVDSKFDKASLRKAEIDLDVGGGNSFRGADLTEAKLYNMECRAVKEWRGSDFGDANFTGATIGGLGKSNIAGADFTNMKFFTGRCVSQNPNIDLSGKKFDGVKFDLGNYAGASFKGTSLRNATFVGGDLTGADFSGADLTSADFTTSTYSGPTKLRGANFASAKVDNVNWTGAIFDCNTRFPPGFKPEDHQMITKDTSCSSGATKNPGVINYDRDWLVRGYMNVCNGDYHADCIYGFLASYHVKQQNWRYQEELGRLAESFADAGYPNLAKVIALKMIGGFAISHHAIDPKELSRWLAIMEKTEQPKSGEGARKSDNTPVNASRLIQKGDNRTALALAKAAQERADAGYFDAALTYAKEIGGGEYNREVLGWRGEPVKAQQGGYGQKQQNFAAFMTIALERQRRGKDATAEINALIDSLQKKPEGHDQQMLAAAAMLAGMNSARPDLLAEAYAVTNKVDQAWEIYNNMRTGNDPGGKLAVLSAIAEYYAQKQDKSGKQKVADELKGFAIERWPQRGDMIMVGIEIGIHQRIFDVLGTLKSVPAIEGVLSLTEAYSNDELKMRARLYAAEAFAKAGNIEKAFLYFDKCRAAISNAEPPSAGRRAAQFVILLTPGGAQTINAANANIMLQDKDFGSFVFAVAVSDASKDDKLKALKAGSELLEAGKAGSPIFRAQLAIANAAVLKDKDSGVKMMDAEYGVPPSAFAEMLHEAGFHKAEKKLIEISWVSADAPPAIGVDRLGIRTGYQSWRQGGKLGALAGMLARDGNFDEAERVAQSMTDPSAAQRIGGTDFPTYFSQQKAFYNVALSAVQHHKNDVAIGIVKENITYQPYKAAINFALARASLAGKQEANARSLYDIGYNMVPSFGEAMGAPLVDPDGLALDALVDRAATEKALGLAERYEQTLSYAKLAASVAENDVQRGKTSLVVDQITQLQNGTGGAPKQSVEDFIKSLNIRDDLNSTSVVSDMAEKYLRSGDKERARAIALYGFRNIDNYPQASGKNTVLLPYASIIARTEPRMTVEAQNKIEAILREVHPNTPGGKGDAATAKTDFVAEGQAAYAEYRRRLALSEVASGQNGTSVVQSTPVVHSVKEIEGQMHKWLEGAIKKYNAEHPNAPETIENFPPDKDMNERSRRSWFKEDNPRPYWIDNARLGGYVPIHIYGSGGGRNLIVPPNIPQPVGPPKGQTYFYMYDSTCRGNFPPFCKY